MVGLASVGSRILPLPVSRKAKEAIKVGLAIVITYWLALRYDWMSATWAGIAVAVISQPGEGQSLYKGGLRAIGTLVAFFSSLVLLALFPQDRWLLFLGASPVVGYFAYKMRGQNDYLWYVAAFVMIMIMTAGPEKPGHAFEFAAYRTMETLMGIGVWALVSSLLWPVTNLEALTSAADKLLAAQQSVAAHCRGLVVGNDPPDTPADLFAHEAQLVTQVGSLINPTASETYEVRSVRRSWLSLQQAALAFMHVSNRVRSSASDFKELDAASVLLGLPELFGELDARFVEARRLLAGEPPGRACDDVPLRIDRKAADGLDHFQKAALEVMRTELEALDERTRTMIGSLRVIGRQGQAALGEPALSEPAPHGRADLPPIDRDQLLAAFVVVASVWVSALVWIYINPPGHVTLVQFVPTLVLAAMRNPQARFFPLRLFGYAYLVGIGVYVFVMPHLSGFAQLGVLLFMFTFLTDYYFAVGRMPMLLAMFIMFGISNEQSYDFAGVANNYVFTMLGIAIAYALTYLAGSPRPEKKLLEQTRRFFRSCEILVSRSDRPSSFLQRVIEAYYRNEVRTLPAKMGVWGKRIDAKAFPSNTPERVSALVEALQLLAYRVDDALDARAPSQVSSLVAELRQSTRGWRSIAEQSFQQWSGLPQGDPRHDLRPELSAGLTKLNAQIQAALEQASADEISDTQGRQFYRLLGSYRGATRAALDYADQSRGIDWSEWREERFT